MRRASPLVRRGSETDIDSAMTPMIDVVFLLLVFFVWTASFMVVEHVLPSEMSELVGTDPIDQAEPPPPKDFDDVVIRIGWDGIAPTWNMNTQRFDSLDDVKNQLITLADIQTEAAVILDPESAVPLGFVIEAYDVAKAARFDQIKFAVNPGRQ